MKLIIENRSSAGYPLVLEMVKQVMDGGRKSNKGKQYCYATRFTTLEGAFMVYTDLNKRSDRFVITDLDNKEKR